MSSNKMTTQTLQELNELLHFEELAYKKCCYFVTTCTDPVLKTKLGNFANRSKTRFTALFNYLNSHE